MGKSQHCEHITSSRHDPPGPSARLASDRGSPELGGQLATLAETMLGRMELAVSHMCYSVGLCISCQEPSARESFVEA